jgi:hypothetical protein
MIQTAHEDACNSFANHLEQFRYIERTASETKIMLELIEMNRLHRIVMLRGTVVSDQRSI